MERFTGTTDRRLNPNWIPKKKAISGRLRRLLGERADLLKILRDYPELTPFIPENADPDVWTFYDTLVSRLVRTAVAGGPTGLAATSLILDRLEGKVSDKLELSGGLEGTLTVQTFREQLRALTGAPPEIRTLDESDSEPGQESGGNTSTPGDDLDNVF